MKLERIKDIADALNIFVDELKKSEVTGHQLNIIGELDDEFNTNLNYIKDLIVVPEVITTVVPTTAVEDEKPEEVPSEPLPLPMNDETSSTTTYNYNERNIVNSRKFVVKPIETEYFVYPGCEKIRLSKQADCQILVNEVWVPISPVTVKRQLETRNDRMIIRFNNNSFYLGKMMLETFVGLPCQKEVYDKLKHFFTAYYKNGDAHDCTLDNLMWGYKNGNEIVPFISRNSDTGFTVHPRYSNIRISKDGRCQRCIYGIWVDAIQRERDLQGNVTVSINVGSKVVALGKLVLETFKGFPKGYNVDRSKRLCTLFKDGNPRNFALDNLIWGNTLGQPIETKGTVETKPAKPVTSNSDKGNTLKMEGEIINGSKKIIDILEQTKDLTLAETLLRKKVDNKIPFTQDDRFVAVLTCITAIKDKRGFATKTGVMINSTKVMDLINKKYGKQYVTKLLLNQVQNKTYHKELCDLVF